MFPTLSTLSRNSVEESLPDIRGGWNDQSGGNYALTKTGAFSGSTGGLHNTGWGNVSGSISTIDFDASRSSSIYQDTAHVKPFH